MKKRFVSEDVRQQIYEAIRGLDGANPDAVRNAVSAFVPAGRDWEWEICGEEVTTLVPGTNLELCHNGFGWHVTDLSKWKVGDEGLAKKLGSVYLSGCNEWIYECLPELPVAMVQLGNNYMNIEMRRPLTASEAYLFASLGHDLPDFIDDNQVKFNLFFD